MLANLLDTSRWQLVHVPIRTFDKKPVARDVWYSEKYHKRHAIFRPIDYMTSGNQMYSCHSENRKRRGTTNPDLLYEHLWYVSKYVPNDTRGVISWEKKSRKITSLPGPLNWHQELHNTNETRRLWILAQNCEGRSMKYANMHFKTCKYMLT